MSAPAPSPRHPAKDDEMYIKCQLDKAKPDISVAILSGPIFIGLGPSEIKSAEAAIGAGATVQWVEPGTWAALDASSHAMRDTPRHVVVDTPKA